VTAVHSGCRHEYEFDPFATLLEVLSPTLHLLLPGSTQLRLGPETRKARPVGRAFLLEIYSLYLE
jgi:hypothetical protein